MIYLKPILHIYIILQNFSFVSRIFLHSTSKWEYWCLKNSTPASSQYEIYIYLWCKFFTTQKYGWNVQMVISISPRRTPFASKFGQSGLVLLKLVITIADTRGKYMCCGPIMHGVWQQIWNITPQSAQTRAFGPHHSNSLNNHHTW